MKLQVLPEQYKRLVDSELLHRYIRRNDHVAIHTLFERYGHLVFGLCLKYLNNNLSAEEAVQHIFISISDEIQYHQPENVKEWLMQYTIAYLNKIGYSVTVNSNAEYFATGRNYVFEDEIANENIERASWQLTHEQRRCLELFYRDKLTVAEIANMMNLSSGRVLKQLREGKEYLMLKLQKLTTL